MKHPKILKQRIYHSPFFPKFWANKNFHWFKKNLCIVFMHEWFDVAMNVVWSVGNTSEPKTITFGSKESKTNKKKNKNQGICGKWSILTKLSWCPLWASMLDLFQSKPSDIFAWFVRAHQGDHLGVYQSCRSVFKLIWQASKVAIF